MRKVNLSVLLLLFVTACHKDNPPSDIPDNLADGIFIVNEGNFNSGNASLTYFETESRKTTNQLFFKKNNAPLGDVAQSITMHGERAYIVVNNSGLIYVINRRTAINEGKIIDLVSPRQLLFIDENKAYVSDLKSSKITIINPTELNILGKIEIGRTSEEMLKIGGEVFVANWSSYNQAKINNQIMVINSLQDILIDSITVGIEPNSMEVDKNGMLWVLCSGGFENTENPSLWQIDPGERKLIQKIEFPDINSSPTALETNREGELLFFIDKAVFRMGISESEIPTQPFIQGFSELPYQLSINQQNNEIYLTDALDYTRNGFVYRFNQEGQILDTITAGLIPGGIGFNY